MSVTFADGRELVSAQCLRQGVNFLTRPAQLYPGSYVEPLSERERRLVEGASRRAGVGRVRRWLFQQPVLRFSIKRDVLPVLLNRRA